MRRRGPASAGAGQRAGVLVLGVLAGVLVVVPILRLAQTAVAEGAGSVGRIVTAAGMAEAVLNTIVLAAAVTLLAVPLGVLTALALRRADLPARAFWRLAVLLPVLVPQFVLGYSWRQAYGRSGFTDAVLGVQWPGVVGPVGVVVVLVVNAVPLTYLLVAVGLSARAEPDLERAARASGARALTALRTVTLPLLRPSIAAASVLVFVLTLESFAVPQVLGAPAGFTTVTTRIYANLARGADPFSFVEAITLALLLVLLAALVVAPTDALLGPRLRAERVAGSGGQAATPVRRSGSRWAAAGLGCYLVFAVGLPLLALVTRRSLVPSGSHRAPATGRWRTSHWSSTSGRSTRSGVVSHWHWPPQAC